MNHKKKQKGKVFQVIIFLVLGMCCGYIMARAIIFDKSDGIYNYLLEFIIRVFCILITLYLQIIIHELGHLVCGLLSGYGFASFRVGNIMWVKKNNRIERKRFSLMGTGGQCLMAPPDMKDGKVPYKLYHFGGVIFNLITAALCYVFFLISGNHPWLSSFFLLLAIVGIAFAILNGIPMHAGEVDNDGYNALQLVFLPVIEQ